MFVFLFILNFSVIDQVQSVYDKTRFFEANFKQTYWNKLFDRTEHSEGRIRYQRPGKMRWDYVKPNSKAFILNQNILWIIEPEEKMAQVNRCFKSDALTASLVFLGGKGKLKEQFKIESSDSKTLVLVPKSKNQVFEKLVLDLDKQHRVVKSSLFDSEGNKNQFEFEQIKTNQKILTKEFIFKAGKNIELVDMPGSCSK